MRRVRPGSGGKGGGEYYTILWAGVKVGSLQEVNTAATGNIEGEAMLGFGSLSPFSIAPFLRSAEFRAV